MIIDRLILFFFGRGPQAEDEKLAQAHRDARGKASANGGLGGGEAAGGRFKRTTDRLKNITKRKNANKRADDGTSVRGGAGGERKSSGGVPRAQRAQRAERAGGGGASGSARRTSGAARVARASKTRTKRKTASGSATANAKPKRAEAKKSVVKKTAAPKKAAPKKIATAPTAPSKARKKSKTRDIHVVFRTEEKLWGLLREGSSRADSLYLHQEDAIEAGRSRAQFEEVELIIHRKNGSIRASWTSR